MGKNPSPASGQEKVRSRYDRKMEARRQKEEKDRKQERLFKGICAVICVCAVAVCAYLGVTSVVKRNAALKDPYMSVGSHTLTKLEYDFYYQSAKNAYVASYGSFLSAMGVDMDGDLSRQPYLGSETMTWKDYFDESAVGQIQWNKALADDATAKGFSYDVSEDYNQFWSGVDTSAKAANVSAKQFIRQQFGPYASQKTIEPFVKEGLLAAAYYQDLLEKERPDGKEIKARYEEDKKSYDSVDYRSFTFTSDLAEDADQEEVDTAMAQLKEQAEEMMGRVEAGEDFNDLCVEYAKDDMADTYRESDTASLTQGASYVSVNNSYSDWLYEDTRAKGDLTVAEDETSHTYTVVEFVKRYYDEGKDAEIGDMIAGEKAQEYVDGLKQGYEVKDLKGDLTYLQKQEANAATEETSGGGDEASEASR